MQDAELKLLQVKCKLLQDIKSNQRQIDYHIIEGAKSTRELLQKFQKDDIVTLDKPTYDKIINYLLSVERNAMYNYGTNQYLKGYYTEMETREEILKTI